MKADVDALHPGGNRRPVTVPGDNPLTQVDHMLVGEHVSVGRDDEAAARPDLDVLAVFRPPHSRLLDFGVQAADQANEDGGMSGRRRALCPCRFRQQYECRRDDQCADTHVRRLRTKSFVPERGRNHHSAKRLMRLKNSSPIAHVINHGRHRKESSKVGFGPGMPLILPQWRVNTAWEAL
jgi:hypothetical protein